MPNTQEKLSRVRKPRVHITYDVETEGATVNKELPFVVGVLGDYAGNNPGRQPKKYKDRKFTQIDLENFNGVMGNIAPGLALKVDNKLKDDESKMAVELTFNSMDDFEPENVVKQIPALKELLDTRNQLRDLLTKTDRSEELETILEQVLQNSDDLQSLSGKLGVSADSKDEHAAEAAKAEEEPAK